MCQYGGDPSLPGGFMCSMWLLALALLAFSLLLWGLILGKAGYHWALTFLMLVPIASLVWWLMFAFGTWPIQDEVRRLRRQLAELTQPPREQMPPRHRDNHWRQGRYARGRDGQA